MRATQGILGPEEADSDVFPINVHRIKLGWLTRQLTPNVLTKENVLLGENRIKWLDGWVGVAEWVERSHVGGLISISSGVIVKTDQSYTRCYLAR